MPAKRWINCSEPHISNKHYAHTLHTRLDYLHDRILDSVLPQSPKCLSRPEPIAVNRECIDDKIKISTWHPPMTGQPTLYPNENVKTLEDCLWLGIEGLSITKQSLINNPGHRFVFLPISTQSRQDDVASSECISWCWGFNGVFEAGSSLMTEGLPRELLFTWLKQSLPLELIQDGGGWSQICCPPFTRIWLWHYHWIGVCLLFGDDLYHMGPQKVCVGSNQ